MFIAMLDEPYDGRSRLGTTLGDYVVAYTLP